VLDSGNEVNVVSASFAADRALDETDGNGCGWGDYLGAAVVFVVDWAGSLVTSLPYSVLLRHASAVQQWPWYSGAAVRRRRVDSHVDLASTDTDAFVAQC
jgi:hypothetical protein